MRRWRDGACLFGLALLVLAGAAVLVPRPAYMDAYYYFNGARQLAAGRGFTEPYVWNYLAPVRSLPAPSHLYWMPLTSLVAAPFVAAARWLDPAASNGLLFRAAQIPLVLAAAGLAGLAGALAGAVTDRRGAGWAAGLLTLFSAFYFPFWATTDAFALFGLSAAGALWLASTAGAAPRRWLLTGLLAGLAHLARADGVLVLAALGLFQIVSAWRQSSRLPHFRPAVSLNPSAVSLPSFSPAPLPLPSLPLSARTPPLPCSQVGSQSWRPLATVLFSLLAGYLTVMLPWFLRNWLAVGSFLAPGGSRTLWLTGYDDLFLYTPETLTLGRFLAQGWGAIFSTWGGALWANLQSLVAVQASIIAFPFAVAGGWVLRRRPVFQLAGLYGLLLFVAMSLVFPWPGVRGGYFHSGAALLPFIAAAALVGLEAAVTWAARYLRHWQPARSVPIFTALLVAGAALLTGVRFLGSAGGAPDRVYAEAGQWLRAHAAGAETADCCTVVAAVNNPPAFYYQAGLAAIAIPAGDAAALVRAMREFQARWLVLDENVVAALEPLYAAPAADPRFILRTTLTNPAGRPVYVLELAAP